MFLLSAAGTTTLLCVIVWFVRCQDDSVVEPQGSEVEIGIQYAAVPPLEFRARRRNATCMNVQYNRVTRVVGRRDFFDHVIENERLDELFDILKLQLYFRNLPLDHFVLDFVNSATFPVVQSSDAVQNKIPQFGNETVIEFQVAVPDPARQFLRGLQFVQHVQFLRFRRNAFHWFDQTSILQRFEDLVKRLLLDVRLQSNVF